LSFLFFLFNGFFGLYFLSSSRLFNFDRLGLLDRLSFFSWFLSFLFFLFNDFDWCLVLFFFLFEINNCGFFIFFDFSNLFFINVDRLRFGFLFNLFFLNLRNRFGFGFNFNFNLDRLNNRCS